MRALHETLVTVEGMPLYLKTSSRVAKTLKNVPVDLQERFTEITPCLSCNNPVGRSGSVVVAEARTMLLVGLTHLKCSGSVHRRVEVLPLAAESQYEYRTVILPVTVQGQNYLLPVALVRTQVDTIVATKSDDTWHVEEGVDLHLHGYGPVQGGFPHAGDTTVDVDPNLRGLVLVLPDKQEIHIEDPRFVAQAIETGALLVSVQRTGSPSSINEVPALMELLQADGATAGVVAVSAPEEDEANESATESDEDSPLVTPSETGTQTGKVEED